MLVSLRSVAVGICLGLSASMLFAIRLEEPQEEREPSSDLVESFVAELEQSNDRTAPAMRLLLDTYKRELASAKNDAITHSPVATQIPADGACLVISATGKSFVVNSQGIAQEVVIHRLGADLQVKSQSINLRLGLTELTPTDFFMNWQQLKDKIHANEVEP